MKTALVIIDMQEGSFTPRTTRHDTAGLVGRLNTLAGAVRSAGGSVIFVQHDGPVGDPHHPDQPGWQLLPELDVRDGDLIVRKTACDSFLGTSLERDAQIERDRAPDRDRLRHRLLRGHHRPQRAGARLCHHRAADGHTTADRPHLTAQQIIAHHNADLGRFHRAGRAGDGLRLRRRAGVVSG